MCEFFEFDEGQRHYSEDTPGIDFSMKCGKNFWVFINGGTSERKLFEYG
jgi:hypothetical protein